MKNKKDSIYLILIVALIAASAYFYFTKQYIPARQIQVYFNKETKVNKELIKLTRDAEEYVYFAIYTFTRSDIKDALLAAKYRGLEVKGITDKKQIKRIASQRKIINELKKAGIPIVVQDHDSIMHIKALVTEKAYASGSYNWTTSATYKNDEVLEIGYDEDVRSQYQKIIENLFNKYQTP